MKKQFIIYLLSLIIIQALPARAIRKIEANPINVAVMLIQERDTAQMAFTLQYYGYQESLTPDTYKVFTHPNGSTIRYKYSDSNQQYPTVEVTAKASAKEKDKILQNLNFHKNGNSYEQKSVGFITRCSFGSHGTLILTRQSKPKK